MNISHHRPYQHARKLKYPSVGSQLDALWKFIATLENVPDEVAEMLATIAKVKEDCPKEGLVVAAEKKKNGKSVVE